MARWTTLTLRIFSDTRSTDDISATFGLEPTAVRKKSSSQSATTSDGPRAHTNAWRLDSGLPPSATLTAHMSSMLDVLEARADAVGELARDCRLDLLIGFSSESGQAGDVLPHSVLKRLARLPVDLTLDLYPPSDVGAGDPRK
jgi:hypothetical protein